MFETTENILQRFDISQFNLFQIRFFANYRFQLTCLTFFLFKTRVLKLQIHLVTAIQDAFLKRNLKSFVEKCFATACNFRIIFVFRRKHRMLRKLSSYIAYFCQKNYFQEKNLNEQKYFDDLVWIYES